MLSFRIIALVVCFALATPASYITQVIPSGSLLIGSGVVAGSTDGNVVVTAGYNTTGASLIVVSTATIGGTGTLADSKLNTWTALTSYTSGGGVVGKLYYCVTPTTDSSQTFTLTATGLRPSIAVLAFNPVTAFDAGMDSGLGASSSGTSIQPGSLTPSVTNALLVSGLAYNAAITSIAVDSGFATPPTLSIAFSGTNVGVSITFLAETSIVAKNPIWSWSGATRSSVSMGVWKASAVSSSGAFVGASRSQVSQ